MSATDADGDLKTEKINARKDMAARRKRLFAADRDSTKASQAGKNAAKRLADHGLGFLDRAPAVVSGFIAYGTEIDPGLLLKRLADEGWVTALPVVTGDGAPLTMRAWRPGEALQAGRWNIPVPGPEAGEVEPDVLLVPLLAFDSAGYRLGYGGGFYDRTLQRLRGLKPVVTVGIAFAGQEVDKVPRGPYDQPLEWILTEQGPRRLGQRSHSG